MKLKDRPAYSWRSVPAIAPFPDDGPVTVMDARCALCAQGARWIAKADRRRVFTIIPLQSPRGVALMDHYGLDPEDPASWLLLVDGRAYTSLDAFMRTGRLLGGWWHLLSVFSVLPRRIQDWLYARVARNRYALFGSGDMCALPDPEVQDRLLQ